MAVWQATDNLKGVFRRHQGIAAEHPPEGFELGGRPMGEIGQGPGFNLSILPVAFAQQDRRG